MHEQTEDLIHVRKVTDVHANWSAQDRGEPGKFSLQLVLDGGAEEYLVRPPAADVKALLKLLVDSESVYVDTSRGIVIVNDVKLGVRT